MTQKIIAEGKIGKIGDKIKFTARLNETFVYTTSDRKGGLAHYYVTEWTDETGRPLKLIFEDYTTVGKVFKGFKRGNIGFLEAKVADHKRRETDNKPVTVLNRAKLEHYF